MGCDIHMVVEVKHGERWVGLHAFPYMRGQANLDISRADLDAMLRPDCPPEERERLQLPEARYMFSHARNRNYELFGALAGVRMKGPPAKGMPDDASDLARMHIDDDGEDGHSHSYCSLHEFITKAVEHNQLPDPARLVVEDGLPADGWKLRYAGEYFGVNRMCDLNTEARIVFWFDN